jgi:Lon protease-like protein
VRLFPLQGTLLLPGTFLPLNVFEPRYRQLVARAMAEDRRIGMIQPWATDDTGRAPAVAAPAQPPLYDVGCLGEVIECEPQPDGRYLIVLRGERRFRVLEELAIDSGGYRRVRADLSEFEEDTRELGQVMDVGSLLAVAAHFCAAHDLDFDIDLLAALPAAQAVNALCAALPFGGAEKQALLEAAEPRVRRDLLTSLLEMQLSGSLEPLEPYAPPIVN